MVGYTTPRFSGKKSQHPPGSLDLLPAAKSKPDSLSGFLDTRPGKCEQKTMEKH